MNYLNRAKELFKQDISKKDITQILKDEGYKNKRGDDLTYEAVRKALLRETMRGSLNMMKIQKIIKNKALILNDLHIPFHLKDILEVIKEYKNEIKLIVFGGDFLDCFKISKYKSIYQYPIEDELIQGWQFLKEVKSILPNDVKIIILKGNHEERWTKFIADSHRKDLYKFIDPNVLNMLKKGFTIYENGEEKSYEGFKDLMIINDYYVNINKEMIVTHPSNFSKSKLKNIENAIDHFIDLEEEFSCVMVAHTHHQSELRNHQGKWGIETGCLCQLPPKLDYTKGKTSSRQQEAGYVLVHFDKNGKSDKNKTKLITLDYKKEKNKPIEIDFEF